MGLAGPKNKIRISNDPQNTTWANDTSRFGHKILEAQGWTPGATLGAKNASHASHFTVASNSHIRVLLKDDNLGLGAKRGSERAENFGLAGLESILGRLNGRADEVAKEQERIADIEKRGMVAAKYNVNFVSGGFLVGDKIEKVITLPSLAKKEEKKKSKKRSRDETETEEDSDDEPRLKRKKKSMNLREAAAKKDKKDKKEKKDKKKSKKCSAEDSDSTTDLSDKAKRKAEKRARKDEKKLKKSLKKAAKEAARSKSEDSSSSEDDEPVVAVTKSAPTSGTSTPFGSGARHAVRARFIRSKKMASMDPQALREIFMVKTPAL